MTASKYEHVLRAFYDAPWAILPEKLAALRAVLELRASGGFVAEEKVQSAIEAARGRQAKTGNAGSVAILPIYGVIGPRMNLFTAYSGGTSIDALTADYRAAMNNADVKAIIFDIDSPGGQVTGVHELAQEILANRGKKKTIAVSNGLMASAAYYIGCCADEVISSPSSLTGSIGVMVEHEDDSKFEEMMGVKTTLLTAGKYKGEANSHQPLSDDARGAMQALVDTYYGMFVDTVAKARGVSANAVRGGLGEGRVFAGQDAKAAGLVDKVATLDQVLARFGAGDPRKVAQAYGALAISAGPESDADCTCPCDPCVNGDCDDCTDDDCACDGCTCDSAKKPTEKLKKNSAAIREREMFLA